MSTLEKQIAAEVTLETTEGNKKVSNVALDFLEIETKYDATEVDRVAFKMLAEKLKPTSFLYVESRDVYYVKSATEFLRYRMPPSGDKTRRSELTFKKKHVAGNNNVRTEVNLRVDANSDSTVNAFCEGLGYRLNFSIFKMCDIYFYDDANIVFYSVIDEGGKSANFIEIECNEDLEITQEAAWEIIQKYESLLSSLGINARKRKKLSLFEMYSK